MKKILLIALMAIAGVFGASAQLYTAQATVVDNDPEMMDELWCDIYYVPTPAPTVSVFDGYFVVNGWYGTPGYNLIVEYNAQGQVAALTPVVDGVEGERATAGYVACGMPDGINAMMYIAKGFAFANADEAGGQLVISGYFSNDNSTYFLYELQFEKPVDGISAVQAQGADRQYYTIQGVRVAQPTTPGIYVVREGNRTYTTIIR